MNPGRVWRQAAAKWNEVIADVGDEEMAIDSVCPGWTVADLVEHTMHWQGEGVRVLGGGDVTGWEQIEPALAAAMDAPDVMEGEAPGGGMAKRDAVGFVIGDLLIHAWDLARSIGADDALPVEAVEFTIAGLEHVPDEALRADNMFAPALEVAADASPQERLLAFTGRRT